MKKTKITSIRLSNEMWEQIEKAREKINPHGSRNSTMEYLLDLGLINLVKY